MADCCRSRVTTFGQYRRSIRQLNLAIEVQAARRVRIGKLVFVAHVASGLSPRLAGSISPENRGYEHQHGQDFQPAQKHANSE